MTYFTAPSSLVNGTTAKAEDVNTRMTLIASAFATAETDVGKRLKFTHATEVEANHTISTAPASRAKYLMMFDASGNTVASSALLQNLDAGGFKLTNCASPSSDGDAVTLGYLNAYAGSLAGLPSLTGNNGKYLTTDGATVSWSDVSILPAQATHSGKFLTTNGTASSWSAITQVPAVGTDSGVSLRWNGSAFAWTLDPANRIRNTSGEDGTTDWTATTITVTSEAATSTNGASPYGYQYKVASTVTATGSFAHSNAMVAADAGDVWTVSGVITTGTISAGSIALEIKFYSAAFALLQTDTQTLTASATRRYSKSGTAPATTAWVTVQVTYTGATAQEVYLRQVKLEKSSFATPFSMEAGLQYALAPRASYVFGNQTSTNLDIRSASGAQAYDVRLAASGGTSGTPGKGTLTITAAKTVLSQLIGFSSELDKGNSGAAITVDLSDSQNQKVTLNNTPTITVNVPSGIVFRASIKLVQDGTGGYTPTWAGTAITWAGATAPSGAAFTAANAKTFVSLYYDGTTLWGQWITY